MPRLALALLLMLLTACAGGPVGTPVPLDRPRIEAQKITDGTTDLALATWPARGRPKAIILALHGFGDFAEGTYENAAAHWATRGITTYAYDQRGFGANPSSKQWPGPKTLADDLTAIAATLRARHPGAPLVVVGHSMGGGIALAAAARGLDADALVLAAPAIAGGSELGPFPRAGAWALAALMPDRRFTGDGLVTITPTDNPAALRRVVTDPRHFADPAARELMGLIRVMDRAAAAAPAVTLPVLTLMGAKDEILSPYSVARIARRLPGPTRFTLYPDGWHWLLRDLQAPRVWDDIADFALSPAIAPAPATD